MKNNKEMIGVLGDGAWGTAVATLLAANGHPVTIWSHDPSAAQSINNQHSNERYLPGIPLDNSIVATADIEQVVSGKRWIFCAVPVMYMRTVLHNARACAAQDQVWVILSKGIEQNTLLLPGQLIDEVMGYATQQVVLSGPSYARDLAEQQITAVTLASDNDQIAHELHKLLANSYFRPYLCQDPRGVQAGGALKNVIALGVGMLQGAGLADNAKAFLLTRGLHEMAHLAQLFGGNAHTVYGLSGVGDLVLTAMGTLSRNTAVGQRLGKGETIESIARSLHGVVPEGVNTVKSVYQLQQKFNVELPICQGLYRVIFEGLKLTTMLEQLMARPLEQECSL